MGDMFFCPQKNPQSSVFQVCYQYCGTVIVKISAGTIREKNSSAIYCSDCDYKNSLLHAYYLRNEWFLRLCYRRLKQVKSLQTQIFTSRKMSTFASGKGKHSVMTQYLESSELVKLGETIELGRFVVATTKVEVGNTIIKESPILVWKSNDWLEFFTKYEQLPIDEQASVLDMFCFPTDSTQLQSQMAAISHGAFVAGIEISLALKLASICNANCHEYHGFDNEAYSEVMTFPRMGSRKAALFLYASKVSHSCCPNTTYSSRTSDGTLEYKVTREILEGDIVLFPYIGDLWETPTHLRRMILQDSRSFLCKCNRCIRTDVLRTMNWCVGCGGTVVCMYDASQTPSWSCKSCGRIAEKALCERKKWSVRK